MTQQVAFKVGLLGPSRVGKTSLITALFSEAQQLLAGSGVAMMPDGRATDDKIAANREQLQGDILAREFSPGSLAGNLEPFTFKFVLDPGVAGARIGIELLDFPGGWLDGRVRNSQSDADWESCRAFITQSTVLLVPVDAALLMETFEKQHIRLLPRFLTTAQVDEVVREWAVNRARRPHEPALIAFAPVKCEAYFNDNGGLRNQSHQLRKKFDSVYKDVVATVRANAPHAQLLYTPIDTIGCVEMVKAAWKQVDDAWTFDAMYHVRNDRTISRLGAKDLMTALCQQLIHGKRMMTADESEILRQRAVQARELAERSEGFFRDILMWLNRERQARNDAATRRDQESQEVERRLIALDDVLQRIANRPFGPRVQRL
ncbi:hypothetical protein [Herbidospora cretacea]|uniref:hypothetical protein n=1 Tax=Herbidospora cretacea TaxID=28444 RepID=UPI000773F77E|nr:hypothetical protein [Herbidospora cretacea]